MACLHVRAYELFIKSIPRFYRVLHNTEHVQDILDSGGKVKPFYSHTTSSKTLYKLLSDSTLYNKCLNPVYQSLKVIAINKLNVNTKVMTHEIDFHKKCTRSSWTELLFNRYCHGLHDSKKIYKQSHFTCPYNLVKIIKYIKLFYV